MMLYALLLTLPLATAMMIKLGNHECNTMTDMVNSWTDTYAQRSEMSCYSEYSDMFLERYEGSRMYTPFYSMWSYTGLSQYRVTMEKNCKNLQLGNTNGDFKLKTGGWHDFENNIYDGVLKNKDECHFTMETISGNMYNSGRSKAELELIAQEAKAQHK